MHRPSTRAVVLAIGASVALAVLTLAYAGRVVAALPADHFVARRVRLGFLATLGRNVGAVALIVLGAIMSIPGVPGQGLLTLLVGVLLLDVPGKRALDRRIVGRPRVLAALNRLRARQGKAPFVPPDAPAD